MSKVWLMIVTVTLLVSSEAVFMIDKEHCFSHKVKGSSGKRIEGFEGKTSEKFESAHQETIDFDSISPYNGFYDDHQHVNKEDLSTLVEQIQRLRDKLEIVEFEQQWFEAPTEKQAKGII